MDNSKMIIGIGVAAVAIGGGYYYYSSMEKGEPVVEETIENVVEDTDAPDAVEPSIPAPADVAAMPDDVTMTAEGVGIRVLTPGDGENFPTLADEVMVHYTGWTTDGKMFDSSVPDGEPITFPLGGLIQGWQVGIPLMSEGSKALIWIPVELAYNHRPDRPEGMLVFEIELLKINPTEETGE